MSDRSQAAIETARSAGALALEYFRRQEKLKIMDKGPQDFVSDADFAVEQYIRNMIAAAFPEDGIVGEEHEAKSSSSGYTWIIDPIDGTANFISGIPAWTVVLAIVHEGETQIGVTFDPVHDEMYHASKGESAMLNGKPLVCPDGRIIDRGSIGTGFSKRTPRAQTLDALSRIMAKGGVFY